MFCKAVLSWLETWRTQENGDIHYVRGGNKRDEVAPEVGPSLLTDASQIRLSGCNQKKATECGIDKRRGTRSLAGLNHVSWCLDILGIGVRGRESRLLDNPSASDTVADRWGTRDACSRRMERSQQVPRGSHQMASLSALRIPSLGEVLDVEFDDHDGAAGQKSRPNLKG